VVLVAWTENIHPTNMEPYCSWPRKVDGYKCHGTDWVSQKSWVMEERWGKKANGKSCTPESGLISLQELCLSAALSCCCAIALCCSYLGLRVVWLRQWIASSSSEHARVAQEPRALYSVRRSLDSAEGAGVSCGYSMDLWFISRHVEDTDQKHGHWQNGHHMDIWT
jgi:hypothetical protein